MTSLGTLTVEVQTLTKGVDAGFSKLNKTLANFSKNASKNLIEINQSIASLNQNILGLGKTEPKGSGVKQWTAKTKAEMANVEMKMRQHYANMIGHNQKLQISWRTMANGSLKASGTVRDTTKSMADNSIRSMLNLQSFVKKIVHYITFSIGVQMVMGIRQGFTDMIEDFKEFERAATNAATISGFLGGAFTKVRDHIMDVSRELSRKTIFNIIDVSKAFYNLASAGYDVSDMTSNELMPILNYAAATQASLEDATYAVATALKSFKLEFQDAGRVVDVFTAAITNSFLTFDKLREAMKYAGPIAGELGLSLEETVSAFAMLTDRGMEGSQAGQRLNMILTKLLKPTEKAEQMLAGLGLTMRDLNPELYTFTEILYKLETAGFGAAEASTMFRARTAASATVLVNSAEELDRYNKMLLLSGGITKSVAQEQQQTLWGAFQLMTNAIQEVGSVIAEELAPGLEVFTNMVKSDLAPALISIFHHFQNWLPTLIQLIRLFVMYKIAVFSFHVALKLASAAFIIFTTIQKIASMNTGALIVGFQQMIKHMTSITISTTSATISMAAFVAIATLGIGLLVALIAIPVVDTFLNMSYSIDDFGQSLKEITEIPIEKLIHLLSDLEIAALMTKGSFDYLPEVLDEINQKTEEFRKGLAEDIILPKKIGDELRDSLDIPMDESVIDYIREVGSSYKETTDKIYSMEWSTGAFAEYDFYSPYVSAAYPELETTGSQALTIIKELGITMGQLTTIAKKSGMTAIEYADHILEASKAEATRILYISTLSGELVGYDNAINNLFDALQKEEVAEKNLLEVQEHEAENIHKIIDAQDKYRLAVEDRQQAELTLLSSIKEVLTETRKQSAALDEGIGYLEEWSSAKERAASISRELTSATLSETRAALSLSEALAHYGVDSDEALDAELRLTRASARVAELNQEKVDTIDEMSLALDNYEYMLKKGAKVEWTHTQFTEAGYDEKAIKEMAKISDEAYEAFAADPSMTINATLELNDAEIELMETSYKLIDARQALVDATINQSVIDAKVTALEMLRDEFLTITNEKLKLYLENQSKILDIEEKLYKLREGEKDQFESLFEKMAEEGLINDEMIGLYTELELSQAEVMSLNYDLMGVYEDLTTEQRGYADALINTKEGTDEYYAALADLEGAGLTQEQIDTIIAYNKAEDRLNASVLAFGEAMGPLMDSLIEAGIVSPDIAAAWNDIADNTGEAAAASIELALANSTLSDTMVGLIQNAVRLGKSLLDENVDPMGGLIDTSRDLWDTYSDGEHAGKSVMEVFLKQMGIWDDMGGSIESFKERLETLYPDVDSWEDLSESQIVSAIAMIQMADAASLYSSDMTAAEIATALGADSLSLFTNEAESAWKNQENLADLSEKLTEAVGDVETAILSLENTLKDYLSMVSGMSLLEIGIRYDFADLSEAGKYKDDLETILQDLKLEGIDFSSALMVAWEDSDWEAFDRLMEETEFGKGIKEEISALPGVEIKPDMSIEDWKTLMLEYGYIIDDVFQAHQIELNIKLLWEEITVEDADELREEINTYLADNGVAVTLDKDTTLEELDESMPLIEDHMDKINAFIRAYDLFYEIDTVWDDANFESLRNKILAVEGLADEIDTTLGISIDWGGTGEGLDFNTFASSLTATELTTLRDIIGDEILIDIGFGDYLELFNEIDTILEYIPEEKTVTINAAGEEVMQDITGIIARMFPTASFDEKTPVMEKPEWWQTGIEWGQSAMSFLGPLGGIGGFVAGSIAGAVSPGEDVPISNVVMPLEVAGNEVKNVITEGALVMEGAFDDANTDVVGVFDTVTGEVIGTFDTANNKFTGTMNEATSQVVGMFDTGTGTFLGAIDTSVGDISLGGIGFKQSAYLAGTEWETLSNTAGLKFEDLVVQAGVDFAAKVSSAKVDTDEGSWWPFWARGGITGLQKGIRETKGPMNAIIGEAGAEAVVPLEGANKKYGAGILNYILPKYFSGLSFMQEGGVVGDGDTGDSIRGIFTNIYETIKSFQDTTKTQLDQLLSEFTFTEEDLEIDTEELNNRMREGGISFKALIFNAVQYIHAVFTEVSSNLSSAISQLNPPLGVLKDFINNLGNTLNSFKGSMDNIITNLNSIVTSMGTLINSIGTTYSGGGGGTTGGGSRSSGGGGKTPSGGGATGSDDDDYNKIHKVWVITKDDKYEGWAESTSGKSKRMTTSPKTLGYAYALGAVRHYLGKKVSWQTGGVVKSPTFGLFGEAGAEALIPLEGSNRKFGKSILESIIPEYYPELMNQAGGIFSNQSIYNRTYGGDTSEVEEYNIMGPINVMGVQNVNDFMNEMKFKSRVVSG